MNVCGFTIVRNAVKYNYPVVESIRSILPIVDRFFVGVGDSDDGTRQLIESIPGDKVEIFDSTWDDNLRKGGLVLAVETNKVMDRIPPGYDWMFYLQADEVVHEQQHALIRQAMSHYVDVKDVEGLLFQYLHFFGTYDFIGDSRRWYRHEIRILRQDSAIRSFRDAQGFRKNNRKLKVKPVDAFIYHYGWVKDPRVMAEKMNEFRKLYHPDEWVKKNYISPELFDYSIIDSAQIFQGTHPDVMQERISEAQWEASVDPRKKKFGLKDRLLYWIEKKTGKRLFEYRNYKLI